MVPTASSAMARRCDGSLRKHGACCSSWVASISGVPVEMLAVSNATIALKSNPAKKVTYAELIGGKRFNTARSRGATSTSRLGKATVKPAGELRVVGQSLKRYDIPGKVDGSLKWAVDMKVPGMVHARNVRPAYAGATLVRIDESSVKDVPGFIRVVSRGNYVAVICEREEQAIQAAQAAEGGMEEACERALPFFQRSL